MPSPPMSFDYACGYRRRPIGVRNASHRSGTCLAGPRRPPQTTHCAQTPSARLAPCSIRSASTPCSLNSRTAALIDPDGNVAWLCWPWVDATPLLFSILDSDRGGTFSLRPARREARVLSRRYHPRSLVLETVWEVGPARLIVEEALDLGEGPLLVRSVRAQGDAVDVTATVSAPAWPGTPDVVAHPRSRARARWREPGGHPRTVTLGSAAQRRDLRVHGASGDPADCHARDGEHQAAHRFNRAGAHRVAAKAPTNYSRTTTRPPAWAIFSEPPQPYSWDCGAPMAASSPRPPRHFRNGPGRRERGTTGTAGFATHRWPRSPCSAWGSSARRDRSVPFWAMSS